jgi:iron(III) transport system permease protein
LIAGILILGYIGISIYLPLITLIVGSFTKIFGFFSIPKPWTAQHWVDVFADAGFWPAVRNSVLYSVGIGAIALPFYLRLAWILARLRIAGAAFAGLLLWLPWAIPGFVFGLALLDIMLRVTGFGIFYGTLVPVVVALAVKELPIGVHLFRVALEQNGTQLEEAGQVAGATRLQTLRRVTLPLLAPAASGVFILVFAAVMKEISTIVLVAGPNSQTLALLMYNYAVTGHSESAAVIGILFAVFSLLLAVLVSRRIIAAGPR